MRHPDRVVFDLDPGPGADLAECAQVALLLRERLGPLGRRSRVVTSGSKGIHVYVPMDEPLTCEQASEWAKLVAEQLQKALPDLVVSRMAKDLRRNKVLVDWSQNNAAKTTVAPYSLRGRDQPTVAAPRTWAELSEPGLRHLHYREVLERLDDGLDPFAGFTTPAAADPVSVAPTPRPVVQVKAAAPPSRRRTVPAAARPTGRPIPAVASDVAGLPADLAGLPADLAGPVELELAKAQDTLPGPHALRGGVSWELKFDGFRGALVAAPDGVRIWSRQGKELTEQFPEIAAAAQRFVPVDTVLDGELCIWDGSRLAFDLLQQRLVGDRARIAARAAAHPASYMVFDVLAHRGQDLRRQPLSARRAVLDQLASSWSPPLQPSPVTHELATAREWMELYRPAGIEGIVSKGSGTSYLPGVRGWIKTKSRESTEIIVGAVIGPATRPESIIAGLYRGGQLVIVGRSVPLSTSQSRSLAAVLEPAGADHPWPDSIIANRFSNTRDRTNLTKVAPRIVAEVSADTARQHGFWRHPLRYIRYRPDLIPADLPALSVDAATG